MPLLRVFSYAFRENSIHLFTTNNVPPTTLTMTERLGRAKVTAFVVKGYNTNREDKTEDIAMIAFFK